MGVSKGMDVDHAAFCLEKLGNPTRLRIVRLLVRGGSNGLRVGEIQRHLGVPASTLSHHILHLVNAGLVVQEREGRILRCRPGFHMIQGLIDMLTEECCTGVGPSKQEAC